MESLEHFIRDNGGSASWQTIYERIEHYYPAAKCSQQWEAGLRGVLYRELYQGKRFKRIGAGIYSLEDYEPQSVPSANSLRMHSFIEGICVELGNIRGYQTFTADPSVKYRDNVYLKEIVTMEHIPPFSYQAILDKVKLIDVLWFDKSQTPFPKYAFEVVDSIGTLDGAFKRCLQLANFRTQCFIIAPEKHHKKYEETLTLNLYQGIGDYVSFKSYDNICATHKTLVEGNDVVNWII